MAGLLENFVPVVRYYGLNTEKPAYFGAGISTDSVTELAPIAGETNFEVRLQAAIDAMYANGGGTVRIKAGSYYSSRSTKLKSNVRVCGEGMFVTKLFASTSWTSGAVLSALDPTPEDPLINCQVSDLEISGENMPTSPYQIGRKGIEGNNMTRVTFQNLYIHDTPASGLGIDNLDRVLIDHCYIKNAGTPHPPATDQGSNGIGIGTGGMTHESVIVTNCITEGTDNSGILLEDLESVVDDQKMYIFANNISINDFTGISISGCDNAIVIGNSIYNPTNNGIRCIDFASHYVDNAIIKGNSVHGADSYGILIESNATNWIVEGNTVKGGTVEGILVRGRKGVIKNNNVRENGKHGIFLGGGPGGPAITDIIIEGNIVANNSTVTANSDGIRLDGGNVSFTDIQITNNRCFDDQETKTQRYGIILSGGTGHSNIKVKDNNVRNNKTGGYLKSNFTMASVPNLIVRDNLGVNPDCLYAQGNVTGATTFNRANGSHITATLTGDVTTTVTAGVNEGDTLTLELTQDGTGSRTISKPSNVLLVGGAFSPTATAAAKDKWVLMWNGTAWVEQSRALNVS